MRAFVLVFITKFHSQRLEELDEIERWRKMARIDAIFFYAYPTVIFLCLPNGNISLCFIHNHNVAIKFYAIPDGEALLPYFNGHPMVI